MTSVKTLIIIMSMEFNSSEVVLMISSKKFARRKTDRQTDRQTQEPYTMIMKTNTQKMRNLPKQIFFHNCGHIQQSTGVPRMIYHVTLKHMLLVF